MPIRTRDTTLEELNKLAERGYVYVILDACDAPAVPEKARSLGDKRAASLYNGTSQEDYWAIAPYICKADPALIQWIRGSSQSPRRISSPCGRISASSSSCSRRRASTGTFAFTIRGSCRSSWNLP